MKNGRPVLACCWSRMYRDGAVHEVFREMVAGPSRRVNEVIVLHQERRPLVGFTPEEAVELFETQTEGPAVKGPGGGIGRIGRQVPFAQGHGVVAVLLEDFGDGGRTSGEDAVVARKTGGGLGDGRQPDGVVIAAGEEGPAGRRAQSGSVEIIVAQALARQLVQVGRGDRGRRNSPGARSPRHPGRS